MRTFEFASRSEYWLALLPEAILALTAMIILVRDAFAPADGPGAAVGSPVAAVGQVRDRASADYLLTMFGVAAALIANVWLIGATAVPDALIAVDGFRIVGNFIVLGGGLLVVALARDYLAREGLRGPEFHALVLLALMGMSVLVAARDLILLFVGLELMSIAVYVLTGFARRDPRSSEAALKYFVVGAFASAFLLYGIALLYGATGTTRLATASAAVAVGAAEGDLILVAGLGLFIIGFAFKVAAVPFHMWTPDAYEGAPTPVTALMATGVKAAAFIALLRALTIDLSGASDVWRTAVWWLAMLTMIVPNLIALAQDSVKRMLAYSSVAHAGYLLVGVVAASALGRSASLFYLAAYTVMTVGSFAIVFHVAGRGDRRDLVEDYRGLGWRRPWLGVSLVVFLISLAGFPPTAGFVGKLYLLRAAVEAGEMSLAVTLVLTSLVAYYYYLRVVWKMYFDQPTEEVQAPPEPTAQFRWTVMASAAALIVAGLFPARVVERMGDAVAGGAAVAGPVVTRQANAGGPEQRDPAADEELTGFRGPDVPPSGAPPRDTD